MSELISVQLERWVSQELYTVQTTSYSEFWTVNGPLSGQLSRWEDEEEGRREGGRGGLCLRDNNKRWACSHCARWSVRDPFTAGEASVLISAGSERVFIRRRIKTQNSTQWTCSRVCNATHPSLNTSQVWKVISSHYYDDDDHAVYFSSGWVKIHRFQMSGGNTLELTM